MSGTQINVATTPGSIFEDESLPGGNRMAAGKIHVGDLNEDRGPASLTDPLPTSGSIRQMGGFYPYGQSPSGFVLPMADEWGSIQQRSAVITDAGSCSDDFDSMSTPLVGTSCTFVNGSDQVVGIATQFSLDVDRTRYVKLDADDETKWVLVASIQDNAHLTLAAPYQGSSATGPTSKALWKTVTPAGASIVAANSICTITAPITESFTYIWHDADYGPICEQLRVSISQRIANQTIFVGFLEAPTTGAGALFEFSGTDATKCHCFNKSSDAAGSSVLEEKSLPALGTTVTQHDFEIRVVSNIVTFYVDGSILKNATYTIPFPNTVIGLVVGIQNGVGGVASPTSVQVHWMHYDDTERLDAIVSQPDASKLQMTAQGADAEGVPATGKPILMAGKSVAGYPTVQRVNPTHGVASVDITDPTTGVQAEVKAPNSVTGAENGSIVHAFLHNVAMALSRPVKLMSDILAMAQDPNGRIRSIVDINSGAVTITSGTVTQVTTVPTVTSVTNINSQSAQTTLLYGTELNSWANSVRTRIS